MGLRNESIIYPYQRNTPTLEFHVDQAYDQGTVTVRGFSSHHLSAGIDCRSREKSRLCAGQLRPDLRALLRR